MRCLVLLFFLVGMSSCGSSSSSSSNNATIFEGNWLTICVSSPPNSIQLYASFHGYEISTAQLNYSTPDCTGNYSMTDLFNNDAPISEPTLGATFTFIQIENTPSSYYVLKATNVNTAQDQFLPTYKDMDKIYFSFPQMSLSTSPGDNWSDWETDPDLGAFCSNYTSSGVYFDKVLGLP